MCECCKSLNISEYDNIHFQCNMCKWVFKKKLDKNKIDTGDGKFSHWKVC